jgi:addiction module RelE/StbE family toxin
MAAKYRLRYLPIAQEDLIAIFDYIAEDSPGRAFAFVDKLDKQIGHLEAHPLLGHLPKHPRLREYGYRVLVIESYLVFYVVREEEVEIHRVIHGSRNIEHLI